MGANLEAAFNILLSSGLELVGGDEDHVLLRLSGSRTLKYSVVVADRVDDPERVQADRSLAIGKGRLLLYIVDRATEAVRQAAAIGDIAFVAVRDGACSVGGHTWPVQVAEPARANFSLCALARILLSTSIPLRQGPPGSRAHAPDGPARPSLASMIGVTQPHISALLRQLPTGSVKNVSGGWVVADFDRLWEWHTTIYSGPGGVRLGWRSDHQRATQLRNVRTAVFDAATALRQEKASARILLSGYEALPAPLRGAEHTPGAEFGDHTLADSHGPITIFSRYLTSSLTEMKYIRSSAREATVQLVQPADRTLHTTAAAWGDHTRTDPLVTDWELKHGRRHSEVMSKALREWARAYAKRV